MILLNDKNFKLQVARIDAATLKNEVFMSIKDAADMCAIDKDKIEYAACSWGFKDAMPVVYDGAYWLRAFTKFKVARNRLAELPNFKDLRRIFYGAYEISDIGFKCKCKYFDVLNELRVSKWQKLVDTMKVCYISPSALFVYNNVMPAEKEYYSILSTLPDSVATRTHNLQTALIHCMMNSINYTSFYKLHYCIAEEPILYLNCIDSKMPVKTDKTKFYGIIFRDIIEAAFFTLEDLDVIRTSLNNGGCGDFKYYEQWKKENNLQ